MKMHIRSLLKVVSAVVVAASCQLVSAQTTDTQRFTVTVPSTLSITAPSDRSQPHDTTNNNQVFLPVQTWRITGPCPATQTPERLSH